MPFSPFGFHRQNKNCYGHNYTEPFYNASFQSAPSESQASFQEKKENKQSEDQPVFEIFGIKLYNDDLLLLGLLFFLYTEDVHDQELFLALVLLLLS